MKKIVSALLVSAAISSPAFAAGFIDAPVGSKYAAVDLGSVSYGGSGTATTIGVGGGFQVSPYVAIEADYIHLGTFSQSVTIGVPGFTTTTKTDTSGSSLQFMAVGNYVINNEFSAFAKAGIAMNKVKTTLSATGFLVGSSSVSASSNDLAFAIGMKYKVNKDVALRAQYQDLGTASMNIISIGAMFNF